MKELKGLKNLEEQDLSVYTPEELVKREDYLQMCMRMKKVQDDVLTEYFMTPSIIRYNVLENMKHFTKEISTLPQFKIFLEDELAKMKKTYNKFTRIERIEYRFIKKIYRDVVEKQGEEFNTTEKLIYNYDQNEIEVEPMVFKVN
jgi:predicted nuclease with TOPRIM domain